MKRHFVLDENVLILAQKMENDRAKPDETALQLVRAIDANCHSLVITADCSQRWAKQLTSASKAHAPLTPNVMSIVTSLIVNAAKDHRILGPSQIVEIPELEGMTGVDEGDRDFVRAAASVADSILATTDSRLRAALDRHRITARFRFEALDPTNALRLAGPD